MNDKYSIDSHKLILHPTRVANWYEAKNWENKKTIYPIYVEISPYGGCNHRCTFCGLDYMGYQKNAHDFETLKNTLTNMSEKGVKSVMFAGEGEPLLFKNLDLIVEHCSTIGINTSLTTNFVPLNKKSIKKCIENCSWIKVSLNAGTAKTYSQIHQTNIKDFTTVMENLKFAIEYRKENNLNCTIGAQMLLLPENKNETVILAQKCKEIGIDYLVIKPYSQHLYSETTKYENIDYSKMLHIKDDLDKISDENFNVVFRINTMKKYIEKKQPYDKCYSTPYFWAYISTNGDVFGCSAHLSDKRFCYGNINEKSFEEIWESQKRKESLDFVENELDIKHCRVNCRMDEVNRYLWRLKNPNAHDNFI